MVTICLLGIKDVIEDVKYCNHMCYNCPCYKRMILRWVHSLELVCHLNLKSNWGLDISCKCWHMYPYVPPCFCYCMALKPHLVHRHRDFTNHLATYLIFTHVMKLCAHIICVCHLVWFEVIGIFFYACYMSA